jgi:hypothetical protein
MRREHILVTAALALVLAPASPALAEDSLEGLFADAAASAPADSDQRPAAQASAVALEGLTVKLSGTHEFDYHFPAYWQDGNQKYDGTLKEPAFRNDVGVELNEGKLKVVSRWQFDASPSLYDRDDPNTGWEGSALLKPNENYISWSPACFKLSAGYQIFAWGVADKRNPTDNLNPRDYTTSATDPAKIPVLAGDAIWYPNDKLSFEGVFIPAKSDSVYAEDTKSALKGKLSDNPLLSSTSVSYASSSNKPKDFVAGAKLSYRSAVDLSLDYLYDLDQYYTPEIATALTPLGGGAFAYLPSSVTLDRKRIHRIGGDAKTTLGKYGLWLEAAYDITENSGSDDYSVRKSRLEYTLGGDVNYGPNDAYYVNLQYVGTWIPGYDKDYGADYDNAMYKFNPLKMASESYMQDFWERSMVNAAGFDTEGLVQGVTCNLKWELAEALFTPQLTACYLVPFLYDDTNEKRYGSLALNPELDIKPMDSFHIKIGSDLYYSWHKVDGEVKLDTTGASLGTFTPSNNVYLKIVYKWNRGN